MDILRKCLNYFQKIDINFDLYIIADAQEKTALLSQYIPHADDSEFFSRKEFAEIASALFYIFGFAKVFYSELNFIEYVIKEKPLPSECYVYNFSRDGVAQGKKSLIPSFCGNGYYGLKVHEAALKKGVKVTGATVHFVTEETDAGPIIMQKPVFILDEDTPELLQKRVMEEAEWKILPRTIQLFAHNRLKVIGNHVKIL